MIGGVHGIDGTQFFFKVLEGLTRKRMICIGEGGGEGLVGQSM